jgi:hypothetical protein
MAYLRDQQNNISGYIASQGGIITDARLGIYRNAYQMRLRESIEADHPVIGTYLGDELFDLMTAEYVKKHPSQKTSLRHFADQLPSFLAQTEPFRQRAQITELARFERLLMSAFDASDAIRLPSQDLLNLPVEDWPNTALRFHPSMQIFTSRWNIAEIWQAIRGQRQPPEPVESTNYWLVWRNSARLTEFKSMTDLEAKLLKYFLSHKSRRKLDCYNAHHHYQILVCQRHCKRNS